MQQIQDVILPWKLVQVCPGIALQTIERELETTDEPTHARSAILPPFILILGYIFLHLNIKVFINDARRYLSHQQLSWRRQDHPYPIGCGERCS
jgi:hypothetical protein